MTMVDQASKQRIKFAYKYSGWKFEGGDVSSLKARADKVSPAEYDSEMEGEIFCPACFTNLIRSPKTKSYFSNGRDAYFAHMSKYKIVKCDLRAKRAEGKRFDTIEEAQKAIDNEDLVIISGFLQDVPDIENVPNNEYDETPVEDLNGEMSNVPIGRHNKQSFVLPSRITTVAGICRNFDNNLYKYYHFPSFRNAVRLIDLLIDVRDILEVDDKPKLYFGVIVRSYNTVSFPKDNHLRMTELESNSAIKDFYLKATQGIAGRKGIDNNSNNRIVIMYGKVTDNGIGLCIERPGWGEFALLPDQYRDYLII